METIGEHFKSLDLDNREETLRLVAMENYPHTEFRDPVWPDLLALCAAVIAELAKQPYQGPGTHALIMDMAMKRLKVQQGKNAPPPWVPVMKQLRAMV